MDSDVNGAGPFGPRGSAYRWFQFGIPDLLLLVVAVAVAASVWITEDTGRGRAPWFGEYIVWDQAILAGISVFFIAGLLLQIRDLWAAFSGQTGLLADQRWGWRFAIFWRASVVCLFAGHYLLTILIEMGSLALPIRTEDGIPNDETLNAIVLDGIFCLLFVIVLTSMPHESRKPSRSFWSRIVGFAGTVAAFFLCIILWVDGAHIPCIVHVTILGIEAAQPLGYGLGRYDPDALGRLHTFCILVITATGFVFASAALTSLMARQWTRGVRRRLFWTGLLAAALTVSTSSAMWVYTRGIPLISVPFAEATNLEPLRFWIPTLVLLLVTVTAAGYRMVATPRQPSAGSTTNWRRHRFAYYHEHPVLLGVLAATAILGTIPFSSIIAWQPGNGSWILLKFIWGVLWYDGALRTAILILAVHRIWSISRRSSLTVSAGPSELPLGRFAATWVALFLTAACGIPTLAWFGFSLWFSVYLFCPWL